MTLRSKVLVALAGTAIVVGACSTGTPTGSGATGSGSGPDGAQVKRSDIKINLDIPDLENELAQVIDTVTVREFEVQDRAGRWFSVRLRPYRTLENKIDGVVIVLFDVDTLKRSQEKLLRQMGLLEQAHEPILMWPLDGPLTYWNRGAEEVYGFSRDEALGRNCHELLKSSVPAATFRAALERQGFWNGEIEQERRDGAKIVVESRMVLLREAEQALVLETNSPITERKQMEQALRQRADDLIVADKNKNEFLAMLAHELRNPLAPLRNAVQLESVVRAYGVRLVREAGAVHGREQPVARAIAGEDAPGAVSAVRGGRQPEHVHAGVRVAKAGDRPAPVVLVRKRGALLARHLLAPLDEARAAATARDAPL